MCIYIHACIADPPGRGETQCSAAGPTRPPPRLGGEPRAARRDAAVRLRPLARAPALPRQYHGEPERGLQEVFCGQKRLRFKGITYPSMAGWN